MTDTVVTSSPSSELDNQFKDEKEENGLIKKLWEDVDLKYAYLPLLLCCFISGLTDGTIYNGKSRKASFCSVSVN